MKVFALLLVALALLVPYHAQAVDNYYGQEVMIEEINDFYEQLFTSMGQQWVEPEVVWITEDTDYAGDCGIVDDSISEVVFYCWSDSTVVVSKKFMFELYDTVDDSIPYAALSHEFGHHAEHLLGYKPTGYYIIGMNQTDIYPIEVELMADCLSGTFFGWEREKGWLDADDMPNVFMIISKIGDADAEGKDVRVTSNQPFYVHGSGEQRLEATMMGYEHGLLGCSMIRPIDKDRNPAPVT